MNKYQLKRIFNAVKDSTLSTSTQRIFCVGDRWYSDSDNNVICESSRLKTYQHRHKKENSLYIDVSKI